MANSTKGNPNKRIKGRRSSKPTGDLLWRGFERDFLNFALKSKLTTKQRNKL